MTSTIKEIAAFDERMAKIVGPARSGKTEALVQRCVALVESGCTPSSILVATSSAMAAQAFRNRLRKALPEDKQAAASEVNVQTALTTCSYVLETTQAQAATGRVPRLLNTVEYKFFLEDMKTTGEKVRKLRNMLDYFLKELANYTPQEKWMIGGEEKQILDYMHKVLKLRCAMLPEEVPATCADYLQSDAGKAACKQYDYVLADDFQNFTRAEQICLCLLAGKQVMITGNPNEARDSRGGVCNPEGFVEFEKRRRGVEVLTLTEAYGNKDIQAFADGLITQGDMDASLAATSTNEIKPAGATHGSDTPQGAMSIKWTNPDDEMNNLTKYLRVLLNKQEDVLESRTCIIVPNHRWASLAKRVLKSRGFNVSDAGAHTVIGGDPRNSKRALALVAYTKLNLLANPKDIVAWRSWCGLDHALTNSFAWMGLQDWAQTEGLSLYDALKKIGEAGFGAKEPFPSAKNLAEKWRSGQDYISKNAARKGYGLFKAIGADSLPEFDDIANTMLGNETAEQMYALMYQFTTDPVWPDDLHVLHMSNIYSLAGTSYDNIFVMGAVDGFVPQRNAFEVISTDEERERIMNSERHAFHAAICKAKQFLVISYFSKAPLELAEKTKMQVARVKSEHDERIALVRPTDFLMQAGNAAPTTTGGQAVMAEYGLI